MKFPIRSLHQIEMTSRCNLRCRYCVHPKMPRPKMDMSEEHFASALRWAKIFVQRGTQREINLAGIGESTMHPRFVQNVLDTRAVVGWRCRIVITTNGVAVTEEMIRAIAPAKPSVFVSLHRPERAGPAVELCRKYDLLAGASSDPSLAAIDWAGQVEWHNSAARRICSWAKDGRVMVMADGRLTRCCLDGTGIGVLGSIEDDLDQLHTSAYSLCVSCDQKVSHAATPDEFAFDARKIAVRGAEVAA